MNKDRRALTGNRTYIETAGDGKAEVNVSDPARPLIPRMADGRLEHLTRREVDVLQLLAEGLSNKEIARGLFITTHTVKAHITRILYKLGAESRTEAAVLWATRGSGRREA